MSKNGRIYLFKEIERATRLLGSPWLTMIKPSIGSPFILSKTSNPVAKRHHLSLPMFTWGLNI